MNNISATPKRVFSPGHTSSLLKNLLAILAVILLLNHRFKFLQMDSAIDLYLSQHHAHIWASFYF